MPNSKYLTIGTLLVLILIAILVYLYPKLRGGRSSSFQNVSVQNLAELAETERFVLDVRESWEYEEGHVPGAVLIPLGQLSARISELPADEPIYVICRSGNRSLQASTILQKAGVTDVRNVQGGTLAWQRAGLALE